MYTPIWNKHAAEYLVSKAMARWSHLLLDLYPRGNDAIEEDRQQ
jgi:hypothetical protein